MVFMKYRNIHIGKLIKQKFEVSNISISQFAKAIRCSRATVYNIFDSKSIDTDRLILISEVLKCGFLEEYLNKDLSTTDTNIVLNIEIINGRCHITQI